jgi:quinol monooxygenase YgiN
MGIPLVPQAVASSNAHLDFNLAQERTMTTANKTQIHWMVELEVKPDKDKELRTLVQEMVDTVYKNESGALDYEYHISRDSKVCHLFERYADADATVAHLNNFTAIFAKRFGEIFQPLRFVVYGTPNPEVKQALGGFNAVYMEAVDGFRR